MLVLVKDYCFIDLAFHGIGYPHRKTKLIHKTVSMKSVPTIMEQTQFNKATEESSLYSFHCHQGCTKNHLLVAGLYNMSASNNQLTNTPNHEEKVFQQDHIDT